MAPLEDTQSDWKEIMEFKASKRLLSSMQLSDLTISTNPTAGKHRPDGDDLSESDLDEALWSENGSTFSASLSGTSYSRSTNTRIGSTMSVTSDLDRDETFSPASPALSVPDDVVKTAALESIPSLDVSKTSWSEESILYSRGNKYAEDDLAVCPHPTKHVDYLSHSWREEDLWASWKYLSSHKRKYNNTARLENASWRNWSKAMSEFKMVSPESLNWMKDQDVTWLYGPLQPGYVEGRIRGLSKSRSPSLTRIIGVQKPILRRKARSERMLEKSLSTASLLKQATAAVEAQRAENNNILRFDGADLDRFPSRRDIKMSAVSPDMLPATTIKRKGIHFNEKVEQFIALDVTDDEEDENLAKENVPLTRLTERLKSSQSTVMPMLENRTIAVLPNTTLKHLTDGTEPAPTGCSDIAELDRSFFDLKKHGGIGEDDKNADDHRRSDRTEGRSTVQQYRRLQSPSGTELLAKSVDETPNTSFDISKLHFKEHDVTLFEAAFPGVKQSLHIANSKYLGFHTEVDEQAEPSDATQEPIKDMGAPRTYRELALSSVMNVNKVLLRYWETMDSFERHTTVAIKVPIILGIVGLDIWFSTLLNPDLRLFMIPVHQVYAMAFCFCFAWKVNPYIFSAKALRNSIPAYLWFAVGIFGIINLEDSNLYLSIFEVAVCVFMSLYPWEFLKDSRNLGRSAQLACRGKVSFQESLEQKYGVYMLQQFRIPFYEKRWHRPSERSQNEWDLGESLPLIPPADWNRLEHKKTDSLGGIVEVRKDFIARWQNEQEAIAKEGNQDDLDIIDISSKDEGDGESSSPSMGSSEYDETRSNDSDYRELCENETDPDLSRVLDPERQALVDRVMEQFWVIFNQQWDSNFRAHAGGSASSTSGSPNPLLPSREGASPSGQRKRQRGEGDSPDEENNDGNPRPPRKRTGPNSPSEAGSRFACPFRKHDSRIYTIHTHRVCALSHWETIARVKEHLYRCHRIPIHCKRCWVHFKTQSQLDAHLTVPASEICQLTSGTLPEGITSEQERKLRSRKKTTKDQDDDDRWKEMFRLLFPGEEVPSPYFEAPQDEPPLSPDTQHLASYEAYIRRELPRLVRSNIEEVVRREMQPLEASLIGNLVGIIQDCQDRVFRSYRETQRFDVEEMDMLSSTGNESEDVRSDGVTSRQEREDEFLDAVFKAPPSQSPEVDTVFGEEASSLPSLTEDLVISDSGYGSEQLAPCHCAGPCSCAENPDLKFAGSADDVLGESSGVEMDMRWQEWDMPPAWDNGIDWTS